MIRFACQAIRAKAKTKSAAIRRSIEKNRSIETGFQVSTVESHRLYEEDDPVMVTTRPAWTVIVLPEELSRVRSLVSV